MSETTEIVINDFNISEGFICTLDRTTTDGKVAIAKALNGSEPLKDHMNEVLHLAGVITTPGVRAQTGANCIKRVLTDLAYLEIENGAFVLKERAPGVSVEEIVSKTAGKLIVPDHVPEMHFQ